MKKLGGARPNSGRKKILIKKKQIHISMTEDEIIKYKKLGGSKWVLKQINEAEWASRTSNVD